jgi:linoleoyl-CoA desaturase
MTAPPPTRSATLAALRAEFRARGWHRPATGRMLLEGVAHLALLIGGAGLWFAASGLLAASGVLLSAIGMCGAGTLAHTASHGAVGQGPRLNRFIGYVGHPLLLGMSATYWRFKHGAHHRRPNVIGIDDDLDLTPLFAVTEPQVAAARHGWRRWYRWQWLALPLAIALIGPIVVVTSWRHVASRLCDRDRRRARHVIDLALLVAHVGVLLALPVAGVPIAAVWQFYLARMMAAGYVSFAVFAPAHFPHEAACLAPETPVGSELEYVRAITTSTLNFETRSWLGRFVSAGVEHQIEHHLFPQFSHDRYAQMAPLVEAYCRHHGHPYRRLGWGEAIWKSTRVFCRPKPVDALPSLRRVI